MRNGAGVKATLFVDGELVDFSIALAIDKRYSWGGEPKYTFLFITDDCKKMTTGFYSGGETGFGRDAYEIYDFNPAEYEIVTTEIPAIVKWQALQEKKRVEEKEEYDSRMGRVVKALNALPRKELVFNKYGGKIYLHRKEAGYYPARSSKVDYSYYLSYDPKGDGYFYVSDYRTKDGKLLVKQFVKDLKFRLGFDPTVVKDPKGMLEMLIEVMDREKALVAKIKIETA